MQDQMKAYLDQIEALQEMLKAQAEQGKAFKEMVTAAKSEYQVEQERALKLEKEKAE